MPIPDLLPTEGYKVPIRASFRGLKAIPLIALEKNKPYGIKSNENSLMRGEKAWQKSR